MKEYDTVENLCAAVIRKFSRRSLYERGKMAIVAQPRPPEALYQDEFYRAFKDLLGNHVAISSEWARPNSGRIDFRVVEPGWGVELLKDGDRLLEHCQRFQEGGIYYPWISSGWLKDWLILDCTQRTPRKFGMFNHPGILKVEIIGQ